jgi:RHS repeat-associated protein
MLTDGSNTYTWNSEDQLKTAAGVTYTYDGDGDRVEKSNGKIYWYGAGSEILDETDLSGNFTYEYIFFGGQRIARRDSSNNVVYYAADHLGTSRVVVSSAGAIVDQSDFYPFGGERVLSASSGNTYKFTSKERDTESNLDNFGARYDSSILGRFMSPDWSAIPAPVPYANLASPQSLNLYSYVENNPTTLGDPGGHCDFGCVFGIAMGVFNGIQRDGGVKPYLKNVGAGILKGAGSAAVNTAKLAAAGTNPGAITAAVMSPGPQALQPSNTTQAQASIITQTVLPAAAGMAAGPIFGGESSAVAATTTAIHFTDDANMALISSSGFLKADTFVTLPSEIPYGASSSTIEQLLTIDPGKGANSVIFDTSTDNLRIPFNGPTTDGGALQFQLNNPVPIDPANVKPLK